MESSSSELSSIIERFLREMIGEAASESSLKKTLLPGVLARMFSASPVISSLCKMMSPVLCLVLEDSESNISLDVGVVVVPNCCNNCAVRGINVSRRVVYSCYDSTIRVIHFP